MLHKQLPDYPKDVIRYSASFQYRKPIDLFVATPNEIELLNKINAHHCHWTYSREPFINGDELVRVLDFLPFYEHLRLYWKSLPGPQITPTSLSRSNISQAQSSMQRSPDFIVNLSNTNRRNSYASTATTSVQIPPCIPSESSRQNISIVSQSISQAPPELRPSKQNTHPSPVRPPLQQSPIQLFPSLYTERPIAIPSNSNTNSTNIGKNIY